MNDIKGCVGAEVAERQERHILLDEAIERIDSVNSHINDILVRINGEHYKTEPDCEPPSVQVSLSDILTSGPQRIHDKIDGAHNLLDSISDSLF